MVTIAVIGFVLSLVADESHVSISSVTARIAALQQRVETLSAGRLGDFSALIPSKSNAAARAETLAGAQHATPLSTADLARVLAQDQLAAGAAPLPTFPVQGAVTGSAYGMRDHPVSGDAKFHHGIDVGAEQGSPVLAARSGTVTYAAERGTYGNLVVVDHGDGVETRYAHQSAIDVAVGERVVQGAQLGAVGSTGLSTGPHLHFEVRVDGHSVDPAQFLSGVVRPRIAGDA